MIDYLLTEHPCASLLAAIILVTVVALAVVDVPIYYVMEHSCSKKAAMLNTEYKFGYWEGCWVKQPDNTWVEYTTIRNLGVK